MLTRRGFVAAAGSLAAGGCATGAGRPAASSFVGDFGSTNLGAESSKMFLPTGKDDLQTSQDDRLSLEWNKKRTSVLLDRLRAEGYDGILLTDRWNIIYFTGLWHTGTPRLINCLLPTDGSGPIWFYPSLDRDLIESWWFADGDMYFDLDHAEGGFPHLGKVHKGPPVDLWDWAVNRVAQRGFKGKAIAVDKELTPSEQGKAVSALGMKMQDAGDACLNMRIRKTPEELQLSRRAYNYANKIHAFARDLVLTYGTDLTDFDIASAASKYGGDLLLADIGRDGKPHSAVGIAVDTGCRVGTANAYPHPNQFFHSKLERGQALQIETVVHIGGCGGELYRPYVIGPPTDHMKKMWQVVRDGCLMQQDLSRVGTPCNEIAYQIHKYQVAQGMQKFIYHRPAHGEGTEGHQPPWIALGDETILETGMCFSVEPGLYDPKEGIGFNFSDMLTVMPSGPALQMSHLPWSEEWAFIEI